MKEHRASTDDAAMTGEIGIVLVIFGIIVGVVAACLYKCLGSSGGTADNSIEMTT